MKVLLVNDYATDAGGAEIQLRGLRDELRQRGHDVRLHASVAGRMAGDGSADYDCFGTLPSGRTRVTATVRPRKACRSSSSTTTACAAWSRLSASGPGRGSCTPR